jgi:enoyl-[acyl-carrier-protein] reductase (NADH)
MESSLAMTEIGTATIRKNSRHRPDVRQHPAAKQIDPSGRAIARAGEDKGIRCNVIAPGFMDTPMGRDASRRRSDRAVTVPFGRQGTGWEVAYAALFLISNESSYVNAHTLFLDGGHLGGIVRG